MIAHPGLRLTLAGIAGLALAETASSLALPWLAGRLTTLATSAAPGQWGRDLLFGAILIISVQALVRVASQRRTLATALAIGMRLRNTLFERLLQLPMRWHEQRPRGDRLALLVQDVDQVSLLLPELGSRLPVLLMTGVGALIMMAQIDLRLAMLSALALPPVVIAMRLLGRRTRPASQAASGAYARLSAQADERLSIIALIKGFGRQRTEQQAFETDSAGLRDSSLRLARLQSLYGPLANWLAAVVIVVLVGLGAMRLQQGAIDSGKLVSLILYGLLLANALSQLATLFGRLRQASGALARLDAVWHRPAAPNPGQALRIGAGEIAFQDIGFTPTGRPPLLDGLNLTVGAGEIVALTGPNGSGKSTLLHLLLGLYAPGRGEILIDGQNIGQVALRSVRQHIGWVPQQVYLFNGSLRENLLFGRTGPGDASLAQLLDQVGLGAFVQTLPEGLETPIGDQGLQLSGGQRQRLAIARALVDDPRIVLLDEATAMVDPEGEAALFEQLRPLLQGRTVLLVSHHQAGTRMADRTVRIANGCAHDTR